MATLNTAATPARSRQLETLANYKPSGITIYLHAWGRPGWGAGWDYAAEKVDKRPVKFAGRGEMVERSAVGRLVCAVPRVKPGVEAQRTRASRSVSEFSKTKQGGVKVAAHWRLGAPPVLLWLPIRSKILA